jgi:N-dimethylarginine dimethylaminohydrolase
VCRCRVGSSYCGCRGPARIFVLTEPINSTQRRFYGTEDQPSVSLLVDQHASVVTVLTDAGVQVVDVDPTPDLPCQFNVRDAAVVIGSRLILGRMARTVRMSEPAVFGAALGAEFVDTASVGQLEGGDIVVTPDEVFVGLGERTDERGYASLCDLLSGTRKVTPIHLAAGVLHLDVAANLLSPDVGVLHRPSIIGDLPKSLREVEWIEVTDDEFAEQAVNMLVLEQGAVIVDARHERLQNALEIRGFRCITVQLSEITKVGGGVRCMTLPLVRTSTPATLATTDGNESAASNSQPAQRPSPGLNSHFPWDDFDSTWYFDHNYRVMRDDDRQITEFVRNFFATLDLSNHRHGIDVGTGTNLYPALTMLPFCDEVTLYEYAASNVAWLRREIQSYSPSWDPWWSLLIQEPRYMSVDCPREKLAEAARVERGCLFDLSESRWDIGTMFFVAESISSQRSEFRTALGSFLRSLRPGAPFAAAFMENSLGYDVGRQRFPAVAITKDEIESCLACETEDLKIYRLGKTSNPLRDGYEGMILATGKVRTWKRW